MLQAKDMSENEGEEVGRIVLAFCQYKEETHTMTVKNDTKLSDIVGTFTDWYVEVRHTPIKLQYIHPGEEFPVSLMKDEDMDHMITIHLLLSKSICKISATVEERNTKRKR